MVSSGRTAISSNLLTLQKAPEKKASSSFSGIGNRNILHPAGCVCFISHTDSVCVCVWAESSSLLVTAQGERDRAWQKGGKQVNHYLPIHVVCKPQVVHWVAQEACTDTL